MRVTRLIRWSRISKNTTDYEEYRRKIHEVIKTPGSENCCTNEGVHITVDVSFPKAATELFKTLDGGAQNALATYYIKEVERDAIKIIRRIVGMYICQPNLTDVGAFTEALFK